MDSYGPDGETPLMFAACNGHTEVLTYLLSKGAEPDVEDDAGNTALMFASYGNHVDCVVPLLKHGAKLSKPNGIGDTPFEIAINKGHLASQYAMEDFLKEEIEMKFTGVTTSKISNGISIISNGVGNSIVPADRCNGIKGEAVIGPLLEGNNSCKTNFKTISNNSHRK